MLMEDQYGVGDVVDAGPATGTGRGGRAAHHPPARRQRHPLAHPQRRDPPGRQPLPGLGPALVDVEVAYSTDLDDATRTIERVAHELYVDEQWASKLLEQPEVWGVEELGPDGIRVRLVAKTRPLEQWKVARELRARLKVAFDQAGIAVSAQKVTTASTGQDQGQPAA
jgi:small conductance mechanosensitive channel